MASTERGVTETEAPADTQTSGPIVTDKHEVATPTASHNTLTLWQQDRECVMH